MLGLHQDLSTGYPVPPLLGARSAQAELALTGQWRGRSAVVASVLVRPEMRSGERRPSDDVVQLTTLDSGPLELQFTADRLNKGLRTATVGVEDARCLANVVDLLEIAARNDLLRVGDRIAASDAQLLMARPLTAGLGAVSLDVEGPLVLLSRLAELLSEAIGTEPPAALQRRVGQQE